MNKNILFAIIIFFTITANAQQKGDYNWIFGQNADIGIPFFEGSQIDFNFNPPDVFPQSLEFSMNAANTSMSDSNGNLLFFSNGIFVYDSNFQQLTNGFDLNEDYTVGSNTELISVQGILTLPDLSDSLQYYLLHFGRQFISLPGDAYIIDSPLFYSKVNLGYPEYPEGIVEQKNTLLSETAFDNGKITATRHANGRDWWILLSEYDTNRFYRFLLSPEGIELIGVQEMEEVHKPGLGQAVFSPDGSIYANMSLHEFSENYMDVYDFDRCTGELSNHYNFFFDDYVGAGGVAISPNSRFLYLVTSDNIRQFDLFTADIIATEDTVAIYDGSTEGIIVPSNGDTLFFENRFFMAQLAPDGKIYINHSIGVSTLAVIENPDLPGDSCNVQQHSFSIGVVNRFSLPNFPNYRLGALEGSPCDTLNLTDTKEEVLQKKKIKLFPNPTTGAITIDGLSFLKEDGALVLYNQLGQAVATFSLAKGQEVHNFVLENVADGIYFYSVFQAGEKIGDGKLVVVR